MGITYRTGNIFADIKVAAQFGPVFLLHVVNDVGGWGKGFSGQVGTHYPVAEKDYRRWPKNNRNTFVLGGVWLSLVEDRRTTPGSDHVSVAHLCAQHGYSSPGQPAIRYDALAECLNDVRDRATYLYRKPARLPFILMPRIGCGLAGGTWDQVEPIIRREMDGLKVVVFDL